MPTGFGHERDSSFGRSNVDLFLEFNDLDEFSGLGEDSGIADVAKYGLSPDPV